METDGSVPPPTREQAAIHLRGGRLQRSNLLGPVVVSLAYYIGAEAAFVVGTLSDRIFAPFWPPNVVLFCAFISVPYRRWLIYVLAAFPAHVLAELGVGMGWMQLMVAFATNVMVALLSAIGVRHLLAAPPWLGSFHKALLFILVTAVASPALSALGGAFVRFAGAGGQLSNYGSYWQEWYFSNALGSLTLGAAFVSWFAEGHEPRGLGSRAQQIEAVLLAVGIPLTCAIAFNSDTWIANSFMPAKLYLPVPLIFWAAVRFGMRGATAAILVVTIASLALTLDGHSVFLRGNAEENVITLQVFLTTLAVPVILLAASIEELRRAQATAAALARFVLGAQDDERRRVATELHENIGQSIAVATWMADGIQHHLPPPHQTTAAKIQESMLQALRDLRALSYLLHPPLLDAGGLPSALHALGDEYAKHNGIQVFLDIEDRLGRLPPNVEISIFRLVEEALANVRQHSGSATARVSVGREPDGLGERLVLEIEDMGKGLPDAYLPVSMRGQAAATGGGAGLGFARMRERLGGLGGELQIHSEVGRTVVTAVIPVAAPRSSLSSNQR